MKNTTTNKRIYLSPPHMGGKELEFVKKTFASNWIAPVGPDIDAFEKQICEYTGSPYSVALSSGTTALHLALLVSGIKTGEEVLCSTFTFAGSAFPITYVGAKPVFVDSDETSWNMDPVLLEKAIKDRLKKGSKPRACILVHLYGISADLDAILDICKRYDILVIEDAAESIGATYKGKQTGTFAPLGVYSFNGNKIITTSGGGMLVGHNEEWIKKARFLSTQARDDAPHYEHSQIGYNYRMSNIVAAIGRGQLEVLNKRLQQKKAIFEFYYNYLHDIPGISFMPQPSYSNSNCWLTCVIINPSLAGFNREDIRHALEKENIESRPLWKPMHLQPIFTNSPAYTNGVSEKLFKNGLCLPSGTNLSEKDFDRILNCLRCFIKV